MVKDILLVIVGWWLMFGLGYGFAWFLDLLGRKVL